MFRGVAYPPCVLEASDRTGGEAPFYAALRVLRQRWWVVVLCAILAPTVAYAVTAQEEEEYIATTKVLLRSGELEQGVAQVRPGDQAQATRSLDPTELDLVSLRTIAERAARKLGNIGGDAIAGRVDIVPRPDSSVVGIEAQGNRPEGVAPLANAYAEAYIEFRREEARARIRRAIDVLNSRIASRPEGSDSQRDLRERRDDLQLLESLQTGNAQIVERAVTPVDPVGPKPRRAAIIGLGFGLVLGLGLALLFEFLSRRLNDPQEIEALYEQPLLGTVPESRALSGTGFGLAELPPPEAAAFQRIRGNLRYYNDYNVTSVLVISALPGEGKSTVACYLAAAAAEAGTNVILLEADLRVPTLMARIGLPPTPGLTGILQGTADPADVIQRVPLQSSGNGTARTMDVIAAGPPQHNPAALVESPAMERLILDLEERYDLVVVDTPASTMVSDGLSLVDKVSGVVVVSRVRRNTRAGARSLRGQLANVRATILGVIVNGVTRSDGVPDYGSYGYGPADTEAAQLAYRVPQGPPQR